MQVILQKSRHAPWETYYFLRLSHRLEAPQCRLGAMPHLVRPRSQPPPTHLWISRRAHRHCRCTRKIYHVSNKYKMELINYPTPCRERCTADDGNTAVAAIGVVRTECSRSLSRGTRAITIKFSVAIAVAVAFAVAAVVSCSTAGCRVDASASDPLDSASASKRSTSADQGPIASCPLAPLLSFASRLPAGCRIACCHVPPPRVTFRHAAAARIHC
jgi:hypothetical protein